MSDLRQRKPADSGDASPADDMSASAENSQVSIVMLFLAPAFVYLQLLCVYFWSCIAVLRIFSKFDAFSRVQNCAADLQTPLDCVV